MATREENIKKINEELEKLSDKQLEQIAGGVNWIIFQKKEDPAKKTQPSSGEKPIGGSYK